MNARESAQNVEARNRIDASATANDGGSQTRIRRWLQPREDDLPNRQVLWAFPVLLFIGLTILVALGITGSSTGYLHQFFSSRPDPSLIAGHPESIRSDEWAVQTAWTISQVQQGLPIVNQTFPGGIDTTVQSDLPSTDWSVAFRPHLLGFLFLPLNSAMALKWWLPGFALLAACYMFVVTLLPRRPVTAALLSIGFFFAPFFQWWYLPVTFWPVAWTFFTMAAAVWLMKTTRWRAKIAWLAVVGYVTVTMAVGVYVPFIIPSIYVALFFVVGLLLGSPGLSKAVLVARVRALMPLLITGAVACGVLVVWALTRLPTIEKFLATVYPGQRFERTGNGSSLHALVAVLGAPVTRGLGVAGGQPLGGNASEASTFFFPGLFLVGAFVWLIVQDWRRRGHVDWLLITLLGVGTVILAFMFVPGWDGVAHILLLDRTTVGRARLALGILSVVAMVVYLRRVDDRPRSGRVPVWLVLATTTLSVVAVAVVVVNLYQHQASLVTQTDSWMLVGALYVFCTFAIARGWALAGGVAFVAMALIGSATVNPLYVGVFNLNQTAVSKHMEQLQHEHPGRWVGIGTSYLPTAVLVQSGLPGYNGFQGAPPRKMWKQIDPHHRFEREWNRLANITWVAGSGAPKPRNPQPDQIQVNFDSCSAFAQKNVSYVLTDGTVSQPCLRKEFAQKQGPTLFTVYEVVKK